MNPGEPNPPSRSQKIADGTKAALSVGGILIVLAVWSVIGIVLLAIVESITAVTLLVILGLLVVSGVIKLIRG